MGMVIKIIKIMAFISFIAFCSQSFANQGDENVDMTIDSKAVEGYLSVKNCTSYRNYKFTTECIVENLTSEKFPRDMFKYKVYDNNGVLIKSRTIFDILEPNEPTKVKFDLNGRESSKLVITPK